MDMEWWFRESNHQVKIVLLSKFDRRRQMIILEKWIEQPRASRPGATTTRLAAQLAGTLVPALQQTITIAQDPANPALFDVTRGALLLEFRLLFLRNPGQGEGDIVVSIPALQFYAARVWASI
jgi:hypothetical protein